MGGVAVIEKLSEPSRHLCDAAEMNITHKSSLNALLSKSERSVQQGKQLEFSVQDVELLLGATGMQLERLLNLAMILRDIGLRSAGLAGVLTYSKKVFLPLTNMCRDRCHYCTFVESPQHMLRNGKPLYMSAEQVVAIASQGAALGCKEALFTLGDRPEDRWPEAQAWLSAHGYESTIEYVHEMASLVLERTGLLPHLNPGVMTAEELQRLKPVSASMGMMLETTSDALWNTPGRAHYGSPDKEPRVRLQVLEDAGRARVPFTTGILVGIGESLRDRAESLLAIRDVHKRHGHIQEVIVQNFRAKPRTAMRQEPDLGTDEYLAAIATARLVMGADMAIQVPPNLTSQQELSLLVRAGISDWGGISPLTSDHVNPERPWPSITSLAQRTETEGYQLRERLTTYPAYLQQSKGWIAPEVFPHIERLIDSSTRLAHSIAQEPKMLPELKLHVANCLTSAPRPPATEYAIIEAVDRACASPGNITDADLSLLLQATGEQLHRVVELADQARRYTVGEVVTYVVNGTIDPSRYGDDVELACGLDEIAHVSNAFQRQGATEICVQGTPPFSWGPRAYLDILNTIRRSAPEMHVHAFRPADLVDGATRLHLKLNEYLDLLLEAGIGTIPGTGLKLLNESHRRRVASTDLSVNTWVSTVVAAHRAGLRSTCVVVYGLGETAEMRVRHLRGLAHIQEQTSGFTELVVMPADQHWAPLVTGRSRLDEHRAMHAVSRLAVGSTIRHIQTGWPRIGLDFAIDMLGAGADDLGGTLLSSHINSMTQTVTDLSPQRIIEIQKKIARQLRQRTTMYEIPEEAMQRASL